MLSPRSQFMSHHNLKLHLTEWVGPSKPEVNTAETLWFFLHGYLDQGVTFYDLIQALQPEGRCISWDARGHGQSGHIAPHGYYHFFDYLFDLDYVLGQLQPYQRLILVGHSMGGMIASLYAGSFPERVHGIVNLEGWMAPDGRPESVPERVRLWLEQRHKLKDFQAYPNAPSAADKLLQRDPQLSPEQARRLAEWGTESTPQGLRWRHDPLHKTRSPQPFRLDQAKAFWQRIELPTLLLYGEQSPILKLSDHPERMAAFPQAEIRAVPAGHNLHLHQSQTLAELISSWFQRHFKQD